MRKIAVATRAVITIAGTTAAVQVYNGPGSPALQVKIALPRAVAVSRKDNVTVFVADGGLNNVARLTPTAENPDTYTISYLVDSTENTLYAGGTAVAGKSGMPFWAGLVDGAAVDGGRFSSPCGLASAVSGDLYVADCGNFAIRRVRDATGAVETLAGRGVAGSSDAVGRVAKFSGPVALALDVRTDETLYVLDTSDAGGAQLVRAVDTRTGQVTTVAGGPAGMGDGVGRAARFRFGGVDSVANPYTDYSATVTTGETDLPRGTPVLFGYAGAGFDPVSGSLLIADPGTNRIRRMSVARPTPPPSPPAPPSPPPSPPSPPAQTGSAVVSTAADLLTALTDTTVSRFVLVRSVDLRGGSSSPSSPSPSGRRRLVTATELQVFRPGEDITIEGAACSLAAAAGTANACVAVDGANAARVFNVTARSLTVRNLVLSNGYAGAEGGGCIFSPGVAVVLDNVMLSGCYSTGVRGRRGACITALV